MLTVLFGKSIKVSDRHKIFIVTEYIGLNHNSTAFYWAKIALYLRKHFDVTVICPENEYTKSFFESNQLNVVFVKDMGFNKNKLLSRVFGQLNYAWSFNLKLLQLVRKNDVVFTGTNPILGVFFTALLNKLKSFNWIMLCHDIFPNNLIPSGVLKNGVKYRLLEKMFSFVYRTPNHVATIGRDMMEMLLEKGVRRSKISVIPNWADHKEISIIPKNENPIIKELGWQNNLVFSFFGNIGRLQGIPNLLAALELVKSKTVKFLFIGGGAEQKLVENYVNSKGKHNCFYYGELPLQENNIGLNCCDISIVTLGEGMYGLGVPSKAYFSMAANKPILLVADVGSELELLLQEYNIGWFCEGGDPTALASYIDKLCIEWKEKELQLDPRATLVSNFSEKQSLEKYKKLVEGLL